MNLIKKILEKTVILIFLVLIAAANLKGQNPSYSCDLRNDLQVDAKTLEFDVYLLRTGSTVFEYSSMQIGINVNPVVINGGIISVSLVPGSSDLNASQIPGAIRFSFNASKNCIIMTGVPPPGSGSGTIISNSGNGTRIGRIRLSNTVNFGSGQPNLTWSFLLANGYVTKVNAYVGGLSTDITNQASHTTSYLNNLALNAPATAFNVTGTGSYCQGGSGLLVGLAGSETGVTYTLYKNGNPQVPTVAGTGSAINFGYQTTGTYTVNGAGSSGTITAMNGNAVVQENPLPLVNLPVNGPVSVCTGTGANITIDQSEIGVNYQLRNANGNVNIGSPVPGTGGQIILTSGNLTTQTQFNILATNATTSCSAVLSSTVTLNVDPLAVGGSVSGGITPITLGQSTGVMNLTGYTGTIQKWQEQLPGSGIWTDVVNTTASLTDIPNATGIWQYRAVLQSGSCTPAFSNPLSITVNPSSAGAVTGGTTPICLGSSTGTMTLSQNTGVVVNWEKRVDAAATWTSISNTAVTYSETPVSAGVWDYRAVIDNSGTLLYSAPVSITVNSASVGGTVTGSSTICQGNTPSSLSLTGYTGNIIKWQSSVAPFSTWTDINNTTASYQPSVLSQTTQFRAVVQNGTCPVDNSLIGTVTVNALPTVATIGAGSASVCEGSTTPAFTDATPNGSWSVIPGTGTASITTNGIVTGITSGTVTVVYTVTVNGCSNSDSKIVTVSAAPAVAAIAGGSSSVCEGSATAGFTNSTPGGVWSIIPGTGTANITSGGIVTGLTAGTVTVVYTVSANGCSGSANQLLTITALPSVSQIQNGASSVCENSITPAFTNATAGGVWSITPGTGTASILADGTVTGLTAGTVTVVYTISANGCTNFSTKSLTVNALPIVSSIGGGSVSVCQGSTTPAFTNSTLGGVWSITSGTGTASIDQSGIVTALTPGTVTVVYTVNNGSCSNTATKNLSINSLPAVSAIGGGAPSVCVGSVTPAFTDVTAGGTWSVNSGTGSAQIGSDGVVTGLTPGSVTIVYTVSGNGCTNTSTANLTVNALPTIGAITGGSNSVCSGSTSVAFTNSTAGGIWSVTPGTGTASILANGILTGINPGTVTVVYTVTVGNCTNFVSRIITIDPLSVGGTISGGSTICSGTTSGLLTLSGYTGSILKWQSSVSPFTTWSDIANTGATYTSGALTQTTEFRAVVQSGSCSSANSQAVTVTVDPVSVGGTIAGGSTICSGTTSGLLTLSGYTGSIVKWQSSVSPFTTWSDIANTGATYTSGALTETTEFRAVVQSGSCSVANSAITTVTVDPVSIGGTISGGSTICSGTTSGLLTLTGYTGSIVKWQSSVSPFTTWSDIANTGATYTSGALTETTEFRAVIQSGSCSSANSAVTTVTVDPVPVGGALSSTLTQVYLGQSTGDLTLNGYTGTIVKWQKRLGAGTWTDIANTAATYNEIPNLTGIWEYRAVVGSGSCSPVNSSSVTVEVLASSAGAVTATISTLCLGGSTGVMTLSGYTGTIVKWQKRVDGSLTWTDIANTTTQYTETPSSAGVWEYRGVTNSGSDLYSAPASITVDPVTVGGTIAGGSTICSGSTSGLLTLTGYTGSIVKWQSSVSPFTTWSDIANTGATYTSGALTQTTEFRAVIQSGSCSSANSAVTTVTVDPVSVGGIISGGSTICSGTTSGLLTLSGYTGSIVKWQSSVSPFTTWSDIANTGATYTSGALTETTEFRAVVQSGSCSSANSQAVTVTVDPVSVGGTIAGGSTICSGTTSGLLTLSGYTGTIVKWQSSVSPFSTWSDISNTGATYTSGVLTETTEFRAVVQSGSCSSANSQAVTVTVDPVSVGGTIAGGSTICSGTTSGLLTLSGYTGSIVKWQSSVSPFTTWSDIANTGATYTSGALTETTEFRAVIQSGSCSSVNSAVTTVTVDPVSVGGTISGGSTICSGTTSGLLTLTGYTGSIVKWQSSVSPFTTWSEIANTGATYTSGALTETTEFRAVVQSGSCSVANSAITTVTVDPVSIGGTISGGSTICSGTTSGLLTLTGYTGSIVKWQSSVSPFTTWSDIANTGATYTSGALTETTEFRAVIQSGSCSSANSAVTTVTVDPVPVGGALSSTLTQVYLGQSTGDLTLNGYTGTIVKWQKRLGAGTWTDIANTAATYNEIPNLTGIWEYRAVVGSGSCSPVNSSSVTVEVLASSAGAVTATISTLCLGGSTGVMTLSGYTGTIVKWQKRVDGSLTWTDIANTTTQYTETPSSAGVWEYRGVTNSGSDLYSAPASITVDPVTVGGTIAGGSTICSGSTSGLLTLTGYTGSIVKWQSSVSPFTTWSDIANTGATYTSGALTQTTEFRAVIQSGSCSSANSAVTTVTVDPVSVGGIISGGSTICSGTTSGLLTLSGYTGSIVKWQSSVSPFTTWSDIANTGATYTSGALTETTEFRAVVQSGSCSSANSQAVTVTVDPVSVGGTIAGGSTICSGTTSGLLTLSGYTGTIVKWQSSVSPFSTWSDISNTGATYTSGVLTETTEFRAVVQSGSCSSANSQAVTVTVDPVSVGGTIAGGSTICSGTTSGLLTLSGYTGSIVKWQSSVSPFTTWSDIANTGATYTSGALTETTEFRAVIQSGSCSSVNSAVTTVTVDPVSVGGTISGGSTICSGTTSGLLTLSGYTGSIVKWQSSVSPFTTWSDIANTGATYTSGALTETTEFRAVVQSGSCSVANSAITTVTVDPVSIGGTISGGSTICSGTTSGLLTLTGYTGSIVKWQSSVSPFTTWSDIANTGATYTSGALTETTEFRAVIQSGSCSSANSAVTTVTVDPVPVGGALSSTLTQVYLGQSTGDLTLNGYTGTIVKWQKRLGAGTWTDIANTAATYNEIPNLTGIWEYRAVVGSGSCSPVNSSSVTVEVLASSAGAVTATISTLCLGGSTGVMTLSGYTGTIVKWQKRVDGSLTWTDIANTTTQYTETPSSAGVWEYRGVTNSGSDLYSAPASITVDPVTVGGTIAGGSTICSGSTSGLLTLTGYTGSIVKWQSSVSPFTTWSDIANTGATYTSGALTQTTEFRAVIQSGSCSNANSAVTTVTVDPVSVGGIISGGSTICSGTTSGLLTLSGYTGSIVKWQSSVSPFTTWSDIANTGATYTSGALTETTEFRAVVQSGSCSSANSAVTTVTVDPVPVGGALSSTLTQVYLGQSTGVLTLNGSTGTILKWQKRLGAGTWTDIVNTAATYSEIPNVTGIWEYRAVVGSSSCSPVNSSSVTVEVLASSAGAVTATISTLCLGGSTGVMTLSGYTGTIVKWQKRVDGASWNDISITTNTYSEVPVSAGVWEYRAMINSGSNFFCTPASIVVYPTSMGGTLIGGSTICSGTTSGLLTLSGYTGSIVKWQSSVSPFTTWTDIANTGATYTSGVLTQTTEFRAVIQSGSCSSVNSDIATVTVDPLPVGGSISGGTSICVAAAGQLTLNGYTGTVVKWQSSVAPFSSWTDISNTSSFYSPGVLSETTQFRAVVKSGNCGMINSALVTVTVLALPNPAITGLIDVCAGMTGLTYSTEPGMTGYVWTISGGVITSGASTNAITVNWNNSGSNTVTVNYKNSNGCYASTAKVLNVNSHPPVGTTGNISGATEIRKGAQGINYSISTISDATTYEWTIPSGVSIVSGDGTNSIVVNFADSFVSGSVSVRGRNNCSAGNVSTISVNVVLPPQQAGQIFGPNKVIPGAKGVVFNIDPIPNSTGYIWDLPQGVTIISGANTNSITVDFDQNYTAGQIKVRGQNISGTGPDSPVYEITIQEAEYVVYPNPNSGAFTISIASPVENTYSIRITNNLGRKIFEIRDIPVNNGVFEKPIDLRPVPSGIYLIEIISKNSKIVRKIIIGQ